MKDMEFSSLEEANQFAQSFMEKRNNTPDDTFQGLSPYQMHRLLHFPFESPDIVSFDFEAVKSSDDAPILRLLNLIAESLGEQGLKATAKGNLPRAAARSIAKSYLSPELHQRLTSLGEFTSEEDVPFLKTLRLIAMKTGYIRKYKGKLNVTGKCRKRIGAGKWKEIYEDFFSFYVHKLNWAYPASIIEVPFFQHSFAFTLLLLQKFGDRARPAQFYADRFVEAFPMLCDDIPEMEYLSSEKRVKNAYIWQVLHSFGEKCGFLTIESDKFESVTVLPLTYSFVDFRVGTQKGNGA